MAGVQAGLVIRQMVGLMVVKAVLLVELVVQAVELAALQVELVVLTETTVGTLALLLVVQDKALPQENLLKLVRSFTLAVAVAQ